MKTKQVLIANPYYVQLHLLKDCIFNCSYCYLKNCEDGSRLKVNQIKKLLRQFTTYYQNYGLQTHINLTGGDIWLYQNLERILELLDKLPAVISYSLLINSLWHKKSMTLIKKYRQKISLVQLNIDALRKRPDDLTFFEQNKLRCVVKIMLSRNEPYYRQQLNTLKMLIKIHPEMQVSVDRLCPISANQANQTLSTVELKQKLHEILAITKNIFIVDDPLLKSYLLTERLLKTSPENAWTGCVIPSGGLAIYPNGQVKLCARLPIIDTGFTIDNFVLDQYIEGFASIRQQQLAPCPKCKYKNACQGGCPATSYIDKRIITKDKQCWLNE